jgi:alpha-beta hydrolase superfamily lysophospholipase
VLGAQLASEGFAVLHIDYDGTGDSSGTDDDPERVEAWRRLVSDAVDLMRVGGARHVSLVGMRLGATLAASVSVDCKPDLLVLWDPCDSGRSYLREQAVLRLVYEAGDNGPETSGDAPGRRQDSPGKVETLGTVYGPETARAMSELTIGAVPDVLAGRVLALLRPERAQKRSVLDRLSELGAELVDAVDQERMLDASYSQLFMPQGTLDTIVKWLSQNAPTEMLRLRVAAHAIADMRGPKGVGVTEDIKHLGPNQLFAVLTHPTGQCPAVTVVLLNAGTIDHTGPGRLWVDLARSWAAAGVGVLRVDLSGIGDSPARPGQPVDTVYSQEELQDVADIVGAVSPGTPSAVVLMGLCSGAYHSVRAGVDLGVGGVVAINPTFSRQLRQMPRLPPTSEPAGWRGATKRAVREVRTFAGWKLIGADKRLTRITGRLLGKAGKERASVRVVGHLAQPLGEMWWWCVNRISPGPRPAQVLERLVKQGVETFILCGRDETTELCRGEEGKLRRLEKSECFHMELVPSTDHSLFTRVARDRALPVLTAHVMSRYGQPGAPPR